MKLLVDLGGNAMMPAEDLLHLPVESAVLPQEPAFLIAIVRSKRAILSKCRRRYVMPEPAGIRRPTMTPEDAAIEQANEKRIEN